MEWLGLRAPTRHPLLPGTSAGERYFDGISRGPGLWKWRHYFAIYDRHLARFRGTDVHFAEVGVYSGGSLRFWRWYFGRRATIYGIDLSSRARVYEHDPEYGAPDRIFVGDQADPNFWKRFNEVVPRLDVLVDDGGHQPPQQLTTLRGVWPHLALGGVLLFEDVLGRSNGTNAFATGVFRRFINSETGINARPAKARPELRRNATVRWERDSLAAVSFYHHVVVLEKPPTSDYTRGSVRDERRGTSWQPGFNQGKPLGG